IQIQNHVIGERCRAEIALIKIKQRAVKARARLVLCLVHAALITLSDTYIKLRRVDWRDSSFGIDHYRLDFDRVFNLNFIGRYLMLGLIKYSVESRGVGRLKFNVRRARAAGR